MQNAQVPSKTTTPPPVDESSAMIQSRSFSQHTRPVGFDVALVRDYYERHTAAFLSYGEGRHEGALHRAVWGPGVKSAAAAAHFVESRIANAVRLRALNQRPCRVLDLGCGVGGSLAHLAMLVPMTGVGITLSPLQARLANHRLSEAGLSDRVTCHVGDYSHLPLRADMADLAIAIESFVHAPSPDGFFRECQRVVRTGGVLAICDDLLSALPSPAATLVVQQFSSQWHIKTLVSREQLVASALHAGFTRIESIDLTPWLHLDRTRDHVLATFAPLLARLPGASRRAGHLLGGNALRRALGEGWITYELTLFVKA